MLHGQPPARLPKVPVSFFRRRWRQWPWARTTFARHRDHHPPERQRGYSQLQHRLSLWKHAGVHHQRNQSFDFFVRVPSWYVAITSSIIINNGISQSLSPNTSTSMHMISINSGQSTITYILSANIVIEPRANSTIAVHYGALLYALSIGEQTSVGPPTNWQNRTAYPSDYAPPQSHDWTINNTTAWDYAIDPSTLKYQSRTPSNSTIQSLLNPIFTSGAPPGNITAMACEIAWPIAKGVPAAVPVPGQKNCTEPTVQVTLVPYGAAKIHMAEFPTVQLTVPQVATRRASGRARGISWSCWFSGLVGSLAWGMWA